MEKDITKLQWQNKDTLRNMTSKYNSTVEQVSTDIANLQDNVTRLDNEVNSATTTRLEEVENTISELRQSADNTQTQLEQINEELNTKISSVSKDDIGLSNVDNTSDMDKPVSTAQQKALDDLAGVIADDAVLAVEERLVATVPQETDPGEIHGDTPELSPLVKNYVAEKIHEYAVQEGIEPYGVATKDSMGLIRASDSIQVDSETGIATVPRYNELVGAVSTLPAVVEVTNKTMETVTNFSKVQGDLNDLQTTDKSSVVNAINELFHYGNKNKTQLVENLIAKGIDCSTSDTWGTLLGYILDISTGELDLHEGNVVASDVLKGKIAFNNREKVVGVMPNRSTLEDDGGDSTEYLSKIYSNHSIIHTNFTQYGKFGNNNEERYMLTLQTPEGYYGPTTRVYVNADELVRMFDVSPEKLVKGYDLFSIKGVVVPTEDSMKCELLDQSIDDEPKPFGVTYDVLEKDGYDTLIFEGYSSYDPSTSQCISRQYLKISELKLLGKDKEQTLYVNINGVVYFKIVCQNKSIKIEKGNTKYGYKVYGVKHAIMGEVE